jgi:hypothetical protein
MCRNTHRRSQGYVNDFKLCAESSTSTMPQSKHSYNLMQGIPKNDDWRFFTQLMYDKIDTLADKPEEIVTKMKVHEVRHQHEVDMESIELLALAKIQTKSDERRLTWMSPKSPDSDSESYGSSSDIEKHRRRNWRDTQ